MSDKTLGSRGHSLGFIRKITDWCLPKGRRRRASWRLIVPLFILLVGFEIVSVVPFLLMLYLPRLLMWMLLTCFVVAVVVFVYSLPFLIIEPVSSWGKRIVSIVQRGGMISALLVFLIPAGLFVFPVMNITRIPGLIQAHSTDKVYPLSDLSGIAIDSSGCIYLAVEGYSRIQVYTSNGDFIRSWHVRSAGGAFRIRMDENNLLHAVLVRPDLYDVFDTNGQLVESRKIKSAAEELRLLKEARGLEKKDAYGNTYLIENLRWSSRVVKISPDGKRSVFVKDPDYFQLTRRPEPVFLVGVLGLFTTGVLGITIKRRSHSS